MTLPTSSLIDRAGLDRLRLNKIVAHGLDGADDGELYLEYRQSEVLVFDNGRLKQATYDTAQGFGLRAVKDDAVGYAHASDVSEAAIARAADSVRAVKGGYSGAAAQAPGRTNVRLYTDENPLGTPSFEAKVKLLEEINEYARAKDARVRQAGGQVGVQPVAGNVPEFQLGKIMLPHSRQRDQHRLGDAGIAPAHRHQHADSIPVLLRGDVLWSTTLPPVGWNRVTKKVKNFTHVKKIPG